jgi:hypothetical protein
MKNFRLISTLFLTLALLSVSSLPVMAQDPQTQNQATALMRGYRTGYSDGYQAGVTDAANNGNRDYRNKVEYDRADRAYNPAYGPVEEYRDGYRQGFEVGYGAGFDRRPFDSNVPANLKSRAEDQTVQNPIDQNKSPGNQTSNQSPSPSANTIPRDTVMRIELLNSLSTDVSQKGDRFQARVIEPKEYEGATIEGHLALVKRPGKAKGNAELQLAFDSIRFVNGNSSQLAAQVIEVIQGGDVGKVDSEGGVKGRDSTRDDVKKVGAAAGIGAVIGAIVGGGSGAAIGATIGAGVGTAGVLTERGQDIRLDQGQQLRIRTNNEVGPQ